MRPWRLFLGLPDEITFVALFFLAVFLSGLVVGLALMFWRARQDRRAQEKEDPFTVRR